MYLLQAQFLYVGNNYFKTNFIKHLLYLSHTSQSSLHLT